MTHRSLVCISEPWVPKKAPAGTYIAIGAGVGIPFGLLFGNLALAMAFCVFVGAVIDWLNRKR